MRPQYLAACLDPLHLTADQDLVADADPLLMGQAPPLPTPVPRHGRRVLLEVSEDCIPLALLTSEVASVHLRCEHGDVVDVLLEPEGVLPMLLQRHVSDSFPYLGELYAKGLQLLRLHDVLLELHPGVLLGEDLRVEVRLQR